MGGVKCGGVALKFLGHGSEPRHTPGKGELILWDLGCGEGRQGEARVALVPTCGEIERGGGGRDVGR